MGIRDGKAMRATSMFFRWILVILICGGGCLLILLLPFVGAVKIGEGVSGLGDASALADRGRYTAGIVVDVDAETKPMGGGTERHLKVRFAVDGDRHDVWAGDGDAERGDVVRVHYDPRDPETAELGSVAGQRISAAGDLLFGAALIAGPLIAGASLLRRVLPERLKARALPGRSGDAPKGRHAAGS